MGDFNIAPEDCDVYDPIAWAGQILLHLPRNARSSGSWSGLECMTLFRLFEQPPKSWSPWWDYRNSRVPQEPGAAHRPHPGERCAGTPRE